MSPALIISLFIFVSVGAWAAAPRKAKLYRPRDPVRWSLPALPVSQIIGGLLWLAFFLFAAIMIASGHHV